MARGRIIANGMLRSNTPIEDYRRQYGLWVKREDLSCPYPGPPFSKSRGVYAHLQTISNRVIGVLDTRHSQAGHAVARACQILNKHCVNFYPVYKNDWELREPQRRSQSLGAELVGLPAGRSAILFHQAKKQIQQRGGYMMPNALKLVESVTETAREVPDLLPDWVIVPVSSGTIAAGVVQGYARLNHFPKFVIHLGYSRSLAEVQRYIESMSGVSNCSLHIVDEGYKYADTARPGDTPPWPCSPFYDLKAFRWWMGVRSEYPGEILFWNIG